MSSAGPIGLLPYQLITLLSPAITHSSPGSSLPSSPTKRSSIGGPTSPSTASLSDRLSNLVALQESARGRSKSASVRTVDGAGDRVWVGASDGRVRTYDVPSEGQPLPRPLSPRPVSPSLSSSSQGGGPALLGGPREEVALGQAKAVDRIASLSKLGIAIVHSEGVLSFYSLPTFAPLAAPGFPPIRGVSTFALDVSEQTGDGPSKVAHVCVIKRKSLHLMKITSQSITSVRDLPLRGGALVAVLRRGYACISNTTEYSIIDIMNGSLTPLMPISQTPIPDDKPTPPPTDESGIEHPTTPPPPGIDPRQRPAIACVGTDEFLIGSHIATTTMGLFVKETGEPCRGTLEWPNNLRSLAVDGSYVLGLLHNFSLEIHSIHTQEIVQLIQLPNGSSPASLQPRSLTYAWQGLALGDAQGRGKSELITLSLLGGSLSGGLFDPANPPRTPVKRAKAPESTETRTRTLVLGKNSLYALTPLTLIVQADALLDNGRAEEALALAEGIERSSTGGVDTNAELGYVYLRAAYLALAGLRFQDAFELFLRAGSDPRLAVRLFPDLREPLIGANDEVRIWAGLAAEVRELRTVEDYIVANLEKNYAPHLKPDVKSSPSTVELRKTLAATARDCLTAYLTKWRKARRAGEAQVQVDSRKVDIVVDTTLVNLLSEQGTQSEKAIVELLEGENDVVFAQVEPALLAAGLHELLAKVLLERGETTRVLDLWSKMVDGTSSSSSTSSKDDLVKKVYDLVAQSTEAEVVSRWAVWLFAHDRQLALKLVSDPQQPIKFDTRSLFARIAEVDQIGADAFLERVVLTGRDADPTLHADLVQRAVDRLGELLESDEIRTFAKEQETTYIAAHADSSSFLAFLVETHDPTSAQAEFTSSRLTTILLLSAEGAYDPKPIKTRLEDLSSKRGRALTFERALVYGKLRLDRQALSLLVHSLHDLTSASRYARQGGDPLAAGETKAIAAKLGLAKKPSKKKPSQPRADDAETERAMARLLVEMSLSAPASTESDSPAFSRSQLIKLVQTQSTHLDTIETLSLLPEEWPLHLARPFVAGALRRSLHKRQEGLLLKGLANSQNLEMSYAWGERMSGRKGVLQSGEGEGAGEKEKEGVDWAAKGEREEKEEEGEEDSLM